MTGLHYTLVLLHFEKDSESKNAGGGFVQFMREDYSMGHTIILLKSLSWRKRSLSYTLV